MSEDFDLEAVYDREISPLMAQIIAVCKRHQMPVLATFCIRHGGEEGSGYCTTRVPRGDWLPDTFRRASAELMRQPVCFGITISSPKEEAK